jgi:hypothetical protein
VKEWLIAVARELIGPFVFFGLWGVFGASLLLSLEAAEKFATIRVPSFCYAAAPIGSALLAIGVTAWLDCALFISLPFADPWCRILGF